MTQRRLVKMIVQAHMVDDDGETLTEVVSDPDRAAAMGQAGRQRAIDAFSWAAIAEQTLEVYRSAR